MRNTRLDLIVGAGLGVGLHHDPFAPSRLCAAGRHPRRDPDGHPDGSGGTPPPDGGTPPGTPGTPPADAGTPAGTPAPPPAADEWATLFAGLTPAQVKASLDQATANNPKAEKYDQLLASLNGDGAGGSTPPTPEQLASDLTAARSGERGAKVELELVRSAVRQGVDPERLADSRRFMTGLDALDLDPAAADFVSKIDGAVKAALEADKSLSVTPGVGVHVGAEGGTPGTPPSLDAQIAEAEAKGDMSRAVALKAAKFAQSQKTK